MPRKRIRLTASSDSPQSSIAPNVLKKKPQNEDIFKGLTWEEAMALSVQGNPKPKVGRKKDQKK